MKWSSLLTDAQRDELLVLRNFRQRALLQVGSAYLEVARAEEIVVAAKQNLKVGETAVRDLESRIAMRLRLFLGEHADRFGAVDIDEL